MDLVSTCSVVNFFFVPIGLILVSHLSFRTGELPRKHAAFGILTALVGFITFFCEIAIYNLVDTTVSVAYGIALLFYGVILLPLWTIGLGVELRRLKQIVRKQQAQQQQDDDLALAEGSAASDDSSAIPPAASSSGSSPTGDHGAAASTVVVGAHSDASAPV